VAQRKQAIAQANSQISSAQAARDKAQKAYDDARDALDNKTVTAPRSGRITAVSIEVGDELSAGSSSAAAGDDSSSGSSGGSGDSGGASTAAIEIADYTKGMTLPISVTESEVNQVKKGMDVVITFDALESVSATGTVRTIKPSGTQSGGLVTFEVIVELPEPDPQLLPGMNATAKIVLASAADVLLVPNTAIEGDAQSGYRVQVAPGGDTTRLESRRIEIGLANDTSTEVSSGLSEGEVVVTGTLDSSDSGGSSGIGGMGGMRFGGAGGGQMRTFQGGPGGSAGGGNSGRSSSGNTTVEVKP
jgi:macrolide-specific efflux system membrane fusion protein